MSWVTNLRRVPADYYAVLGIIALYVVVAGIRLGLPGVHYDEALYVNAARGGVDNVTFMTKTFYGFPVLLMPYIGALKAYIFYPIFAVFGVGAVTMRFPSLVFSAVALWLLYLLVRRHVSRLLGVSMVAVTALTASFMVFTRLDFGPVVLDFLLKILALAVLLQFAARPRMRWLILFWLLLFVGVFNKLNYLWYVNAFVLAFAAVYGRGLWQRLNKAMRLRVAVISVVGYGLCVGYYGLLSKAYHLGGSLGFVGFRLFYDHLSTLVSGSWFYNYAFSRSHISTHTVFWIMTAIVLAGAGCAAWQIRQDPKLWDKQARFGAFFGLVLVVLLGEVAMTLKATAGWHYFSVYPFFGAVWVLALSYVARFAWPRRRQFQALVVGGLVALASAYQLFVYSGYIKAYARPAMNPGWSPAIYKLISYAKAHNGTFVSMDWGTQTQLIGFDPVHGKYLEMFGPLDISNPITNKWLYDRYIGSVRNGYYIGTAPGEQNFPEVQKDFFTLALQHGLHPRRVAVIADKKPVYYVYQLVK
ncbi:MAG TPA: glycosyltransferase family 39 protein [Candidatus Saccharimonadales bacterium]|nr:glycosyltransferase family 39 protein [Candidatus Saccharimonadales bacterium]